MPVVMLGREIGHLAPGQVIKVLATDRCAVTDVPAWTRDTGHDLLHWHEAGDHLVFYIRKGVDEG
jgi:TusA-related sulfurtransferase